MLSERNCILRDSDHVYLWDPEGTAERMRVSVTGVINHFKPPYDGPPEAGWRGTHVHRCMEALARDEIEARSIIRRQLAGDEDAGEVAPENMLQLDLNDGHISPEGIDCGAWFHQLQLGAIGKSGLTMADFWKEAEVIATEYTMVDRRKSLGGQLDLLVRFRDEVWLVDLKTKGASWKGPRPEDRYSYSAQAGGYMHLLACGDGVAPAEIPLIDKCRTLVVTPDRVEWLSAMQPDQCSLDWEECWGAYSADALVAF